jgi:hypothetical protein
VQPGSGNPTPQLPELVRDPTASLRPQPAEIVLAGESFTVPARCAADWLEVLMGGVDLDEVFPGLCDEDEADDVRYLMLEEVFTSQAVENATLDLISFAAGRPWWVALRMIQLAESQWSILGAALILHHVDPERLSLSAWLDALWATIFDHVPRDKWLTLASEIEMPPKELNTDPFDTMDMSVEQFTMLMSG